MDPKSVKGRPLLCFTDEDDPATDFGVSWVRKLPKNTSSVDSLERARIWIQQCKATPRRKSGYQVVLPGSIEDQPPPSTDHAWTIEDISRGKVDPEPFPQERPERLLRLTTDKGDITACLIETAGNDYEYTILSYSWGGSTNRPWLTTTENMKEHLQSVEVRQLPPTLRDAISITVALGFSYVWIDALCIVQDSPLDWATETSKMGGIYRGSVVMIAASGATSVEQGLFNTRSSSTIHEIDRQYLVVLNTTLNNGRPSRLYLWHAKSLREEISDTFQQSVLRGPLAKRGWTLQEHVMAPRTLYYTPSQLMWECSHCRLSEDNFPQHQGQKLYPMADLIYPVHPKTLVRMWYMNLVEEFSQRSFTKFEDKLPAITALAKATFFNRHIDYIAGLWKDSLMTGLCWYRKGSGRKMEDYCCPSWSWASQNSPVLYTFAERSAENPRGFAPKILSVHVEQDPLNPFGNAKAAHIMLKTAVMTGIVVRGEFETKMNRRDSSLVPRTLRQGLFISSPHRKLQFRLDAIMDSEGNPGMLVIVAALFGRKYGEPVFLLLTSPDIAADAYRRVGIATIASTYGEKESMDDIVSGWEERTIKLI
ncbi:hypothetical protein H2200_008824 [Cladophialophora chaetospira]|uniref:Heterokaryon incompatibility domain-containing protein n=1 Tax=Cladophialophora chaetospira TaxID=386627 RepID=A0AA38X4R3_9EURO|nr:hypothetical protein H2200_008824 [Cladophialophora chaetospira]